MRRAKCSTGRVATCGTPNHSLRSSDFFVGPHRTDVLLWIAAGKSNRDIADILGLSHRTIDKYLDQIYLKISVENRASAAAKAVRVLSGH
jgi:DNA-binding NarL/FixJ family response regulator